MNYNFDEVINRKGTFSSKWDNVGARVGNPDALPMWVADSDFRCPQPVLSALTKHLDHGILGYTYLVPEFAKATQNWVFSRHGWKIETSWVSSSSGIVPVLNTMVQTFTEPGDEVIIQQPVYYPFVNAIVDNNRVVSSNSLQLENGRYEIDFDDLVRRARNPKAKLMILCNPHNPVGRVFTKDELKRMGEICIENHVILLSDEIHSDLVFPGHKHIPLASISPEISANTVTTIAPSKTFNMAGLRTSGVIISNDEIAKKLNAQFNKNKTVGLGILGLIGYIAAYNECADYADQLVEYLYSNVDYLGGFLKTKMPKIKLIRPEGTYLMWLDCRELGMNNKELDDFVIQKCRVAVDSGYWFGCEGNGFMRMNIACPNVTLRQGLEQIYSEYIKL